VVLWKASATREATASAALHQYAQNFDRVERDELPQLRSFAAGLKRDLAAVVNGLTTPYGSGAVEGTVNRIKTLKRQMYGRANFDLLRKRVLLAR
jgi:transposase